MPNQRTKVVPIRRDILASDEVVEVADYAFNLWLSNGFRGGSPEEALFTAVRQMRRTSTAGPFLVPKRTAMRSNVYPFSLVALN
jgi:hypothetical protein